MARDDAVYLVPLLALTLLLVATTAAIAASPKCCTDNHTWGNGTPETTGCSPAQNNTCNDWCFASCRGGECKLRSSKLVCHCYC